MTVDSTRGQRNHQETPSVGRRSTCTCMREVLSKQHGQAMTSIAGALTSVTLHIEGFFLFFGAKNRSFTKIKGAFILIFFSLKKDAE